MNKIKDIAGTIILPGAFLVRQFDDNKKTLFAGVAKTLPFEHKEKFPEDEIWVTQIMIINPKRYTLKGSRYEGWLLEDILSSDFKLNELKEVSDEEN